MAEIKEGDTIRVQYCKGETGWAKYLGDLKVEIANSPVLREDLNFGDIALLDADPNKCETLTTVVKVLSTAYPVKARVQYDSLEEFIALKKAVDEKEGSVEGWLSPSHDRRGCVAVSMRNGTVEDIYNLATTVGITNPEKGER